MVFTYAKEKRADMPKEVTSRKDCWYGINCNTMRHNEDHAKKLNHICNQVQNKIISHLIKLNRPDLDRSIV